MGVSTLNPKCRRTQKNLLSDKVETGLALSGSEATSDDDHIISKRTHMKLLSIGNDAKTKKGEKLGVLTGILYLAPFTTSGVFNTCPSATPGCADSCLYYAGMGKFANVQSARVAKTKFFFNDREGFKAQLRKDILELTKKAEKLGMSPAVRLNGTSDIGFETVYADLLAEFPNVQFYDYTKVKSRMLRYLQGKAPANYSLTFSRAESNAVDAWEIMALGGNVAAVFKEVPTEYMGFKVIDGDESDARFLDERGVIVGLKAKGLAKKDTTGFVIC